MDFVHSREYLFNHVTIVRLMLRMISTTTACGTFKRRGNHFGNWICALNTWGAVILGTCEEWLYHCIWWLHISMLECFHSHMLYYNVWIMMSLISLFKVVSRNMHTTNGTTDVSLHKLLLFLIHGCSCCHPCSNLLLYLQFFFGIVSHSDSSSTIFTCLTLYSSLLWPLKKTIQFLSFSYMLRHLNWHSAFD